MSLESLFDKLKLETDVEDRTRRAEAVPTEPTVEERLYREGYKFDFFQAVRLLQMLAPEKRPVGHHSTPSSESIRFSVHQTLSFPASAVSQLQVEKDGNRSKMSVAFMGLTGPCGALPRHYTEMIRRLEMEGKGAEKRALRDWFDLFNHRMISLFYRAWEKYRFHLAYERGETKHVETETFTRSLLSLLGLGMKPLRNRIRVACWDVLTAGTDETVLAEMPDTSLLRYGGFLTHRLRPAGNLQAMLADYFQVPVEVDEFRGEWLRVETFNQSRLEYTDTNNRLGTNALLGEQVWEIQGKVRVRVGPLTFEQFEEFLPDEAPVARRKTFYLLCQLIRLFLGTTLDFEVQLILGAKEVPESELGFSEEEGSRLGWNSWLRDENATRDADETVFEGSERSWINPGEEQGTL